jgi:septum formation protein
MIYLASSSQRRAELLRQIGIKFKILETNIDESQFTTESAQEYVCRMAETKARAGEKMLSNHNELLPVLAADTIISIDGSIIGKPDNSQHCRCILAKLSAREHQVLSAVAFSFKGRLDLKISVNQVRFRALEEWEIESYCAHSEVLDKAGAYAIQGKAAIFIEYMEGSYSSVMGLPLFETAKLLRQAGISVLKP